MTYDILYDILNVYLIGIADTFLQLWFSRGFLKSEISSKKYILLILIEGAVINLLPVGYLACSVIYTLILFITGTAVMRSDKKSAAICAVTSMVIMQLCFGICAGIEGMLLKYIYNTEAAFIIAVVGNILPLVMSYIFYKIIMLKIPLYTAVNNSPIAVIFPLILIFGLDLFINNSLYGNTISTEDMLPAGTHAKLLAVQFLCLASVLCIIYAYSKLIASQAAEREYRLNKQYAEKSKALYDNAASFRHDFKNHLLVIAGLIDKKEYEKAKIYTENLYGQSSIMSFRYSTGRPVVDILIEEKLPQDDDINIICDLKIPSDFEIDDIDLCIIISNALDNALSACKKVSSDKFIYIYGRRTANMLLIEFENSYDGKAFSEGTGLANIRAAANKYNGKAFIKADNNRFDLKILFNISRH